MRSKSETAEKLGIPLHEQQIFAGVAVDAVFDSVSVATTFKSKLEEHGVFFCSISEAVQQQDFVESFEAARSVLPGTAVPWVRSLREEAAARFARLGWPTRKLEAWKYTDASALRQVPWRDVRCEDGAARIDFIPSLFAPEHPRFRLVFVHGGGMAADAVAYHPRNLVVEEGSSLTLIEHHLGIGDGAYFANSVTELQVRDGGQLRRYVLQSEGDQGLHVDTVHAEVGRDATLEAFGLARGGRLARSEVLVRLEGPGARCGLAGAYVCPGKQVCDNTTRPSSSTAPRTPPVGRSSREFSTTRPAVCSRDASSCTATSGTPTAIS